PTPTHPLSLHDALPISHPTLCSSRNGRRTATLETRSRTMWMSTFRAACPHRNSRPRHTEGVLDSEVHRLSSTTVKAEWGSWRRRSEEHTSELQSLTNLV